MSTKYYAHFLLRERAPQIMNEYRGVVEVSRAPSHRDANAATSLLAKNFECEPGDIQVLQWARLQ
jgi:hypothetical protein